MIHVTALCIFPLKSHGLVGFGWLLAFLALQPLLVSFVPSPLFGFCCCPPSGRLPFGTCLWISPTVGLPLDFACQFPVDFCSSCSICSRSCIHRPVKDPGLSGAWAEEGFLRRTSEDWLRLSTSSLWPSRLWLRGLRTVFLEVGSWSRRSPDHLVLRSRTSSSFTVCTTLILGPPRFLLGYWTLLTRSSKEEPEIPFFEQSELSLRVFGPRFPWTPTPTTAPSSPSHCKIGIGLCSELLVFRSRSLSLPRKTWRGWWAFQPPLCLRASPRKPRSFASVPELAFLCQAWSDGKEAIEVCKQGGPLTSGD